MSRPYSKKLDGSPYYLTNKADVENGTPSARQRRSKLVRSLFVFGGVGFAIYGLCNGLVHFCQSEHGVQLLDNELFSSMAMSQDVTAAACPQAGALQPKKQGQLWEDLTTLYDTQEFENRAIEWLSGAVKVPTESYDDLLPVGEDPRWEVFKPFHVYLEKAFPLVHKSLRLTKINTYGLVFEWEGKQSELKPLMLMGHQDVVPVDPNTVDQWTHPPYSGYFDGKMIWGRGSIDDKSGLIGILSSVETLLEKGFKPTRPVVLAFGMDEEVSGRRGAVRIREYLLEKYGTLSMAMIIDEGGGFTEQHGSMVASINAAEKGIMDIRLKIETAGGHSSVPPKHTSIGMISEMIVKIESNPFPATLTRTSPIYAALQCLSAHTSDFPDLLRKKLLAAEKGSNKALKAAEAELLKHFPEYTTLLQTTQAVDLIQGGVKTNALPEQVNAVVNHRISTDSSIADTQSHHIRLLLPLAKAYNLSIHAFGKQLTSDSYPSSGKLILSDAWGTATEPIPISPTRGDEAKPYEVLAGTIVSTYKQKHNGDDIVVAPAMMTGNTDARYMGPLSQHIFRYNHNNIGFVGGKGGLGGVHTVNEAYSAAAFVEEILFFTTLILNADEATNF